MRAREFLKEANGLSQMKTDIIQQVQSTSDEDLVQKIYTVINKSGLSGRIAPVLQRDTDTKGYVDQLVEMIIDTPGSYAEKQAFVNEYPNGYIDIQLMLSGEYIKFEDLIKGSNTAPIAFVRRLFDSLKQVTFGTAKGPGEFALAVLSPYIKITGKGDLNIGKEVIEVKAAATKSGGRVGTPGLLRSDNIAEIIKKHTELEFQVGEGLNLKQLSATLDSAGLDADAKKACATELFDYIFKGEVDTSNLVGAVVSGGDPNPYYLKANYEIYQAESGFSGMMLMNFPSQSLKYFRDPMQMSQEIYAFNVYLISGTPGFTSRQILSQVTLRPVKEPTSPAKIKSAAKKSVKKPTVSATTPAVTPAVPPGIQNQTSPLGIAKIPMGQQPQSTV